MDPGTVGKRKLITNAVATSLLLLALIFTQLCHMYGKRTENKHVRLVLPVVVVVMNMVVRRCFFVVFFFLLSCLCFSV